jgi:hypothetical protein
MSTASSVNDSDEKAVEIWHPEDGDGPEPTAIRLKLKNTRGHVRASEYGYKLYTHYLVITPMWLPPKNVDIGDWHVGELLLLLESRDIAAGTLQTNWSATFSREGHVLASRDARDPPSVTNGFFNIAFGKTLLCGATAAKRMRWNVHDKNATAKAKRIIITTSTYKAKGINPVAHMDVDPKYIDEILSTANIHSNIRQKARALKATQDDINDTTPAIKQPRKSTRTKPPHMTKSPRAGHDEMVHQPLGPPKTSTVALSEGIDKDDEMTKTKSGDDDTWLKSFALHDIVAIDPIVRDLTKQTDDMTGVEGLHDAPAGFSFDAPVTIMGSWRLDGTHVPKLTGRIAYTENNIADHYDQYTDNWTGIWNNFRAMMAHRQYTSFPLWS